MVSKIHIIIVAGGSGSRFGGPLPKQFLPLDDGRPVICHTIDNLRSACPQAAITVVLSPDYEDLFNSYGYADIALAHGGRTRWESVRNGLATVPDGIGIVMVHDAARPFVGADMIERLLQGLETGASGAVPVVPVTDSLRRIDGDKSEAVDRSTLRAVQTPQAFNSEILLGCYRMPYQDSFTDDASVVEAYTGAPVCMTDGEWYNIKITNPADIALANHISHTLGL